MQLWERSYAHYQKAVELSPDDARIVNDCGLMLIYHLNRDFDRARALFDRAIAVGQAQLDALPREEPLHRGDAVEVVDLGAELLRQRAGTLARNSRWQVALRGDELSVHDGQRARSSRIERTRLFRETHAERTHGAAVAGAVDATELDERIGAVLDHTDAAIAELAGAPQLASTRLHLIETRRAALRAMKLAAHLRP